MIALNDWDHTQVVSGLEGDERLAVIGAAQLQAQQQEFLSRMRQRRGGGPLGH
jgi:HlyD family secretion protein